MDLWRGAAQGVLTYEFELKQETPSLNAIRGMNRFAYRDLRHAWQLMVFMAIKARHPDKAIPRSFLHITRRCAGTGLDWDNAYGGLKPLLDCLVKPTKRNPSGLGLIHDDGPKSMPYPPYLAQETAPAGKGSTLVRIYQLP